MIEMIRNIGQEIMVFDQHGHYELRGRIAGRHKLVGGEYFYDVQPNKAESMSVRIHAIPGSQLRSVSKPILAYERGPLPEPKHIKDDA